MFEASLVNDQARTARPYTVTFSLALQLTLAAMAFAYPLWHIEALPVLKLHVPSPFRRIVELVDPLPAQPRSAAPMVMRRPEFSFARFTPRPNAAASASLDIDVPVIGGDADGLPTVPGGVPVPGLFGTGGPVTVQPPVVRQTTRVEPTATPAQRGPVTVGGKVRAPQLLREVKPAYPSLARAARIQGTVKIEAILSADGTVRDARVVSGHPLLLAAALDAVRQWLYRPTVLNDVPVEVKLAIDVNFTLSH
jgi:periplasmic protein TonB